MELGTSTSLGDSQAGMFGAPSLRSFWRSRPRIPEMLACCSTCPSFPGDLKRPGHSPPLRTGEIKRRTRSHPRGMPFVQGLIRRGRHWRLGAREIIQRVNCTGFIASLDFTARSARSWPPVPSGSVCQQAFCISFGPCMTWCRSAHPLPI